MRLYSIVNLTPVPSPNPLWRGPGEVDPAGQAHWIRQPTCHDAAMKLGYQPVALFTIGHVGLVRIWQGQSPAQAVAHSFDYSKAMPDVQNNLPDPENVGVLAGMVFNPIYGPSEYNPRGIALWDIEIELMRPREDDTPKRRCDVLNRHLAVCRSTQWVGVTWAWYDLWDVGCPLAGGVDPRDVPEVWALAKQLLSLVYAIIQDAYDNSVIVANEGRWYTDLSHVLQFRSRYAPEFSGPGNGTVISMSPWWDGTGTSLDGTLRSLSQWQARVDFIRAAGCDLLLWPAGASGNVQPYLQYAAGK